jgi:hypothetical protein
MHTSVTATYLTIGTFPPWIVPICVVPDPGWVIVNSLRKVDPEEDRDYQPKGIHGYDNDNEHMRSLFIAKGLGFKYGYDVKPFENVEVYGITANLLEIEPNLNKGTLKNGWLQQLPALAVATIPPMPEVSSVPEVSPVPEVPPVPVVGSVLEVPPVPDVTPVPPVSIVPTVLGVSSVPKVTEIPNVTPEDWEQIEDDLEEAGAEDGPLTWKEYLELKAEQMREEMESWWDWVKNGGSDSS